MSCLDVMYQVYGPPQPYFAAAYSPYHHQGFKPARQLRDQYRRYQVSKKHVLLESGAISTQSSAYPRPSMHDVYGTHFDPRYSSLLVPSVRPHRLTNATVSTPGTSQCDLGKSEPATSAWTTPGAFTGPGADMGQSLSLNVDAGLQPQDKSKDLYWF
ncbi:hypothetical protein EOD39_7198 [Acipenser ruthenus]|uniref:Uncharacterized protein n=1 Tax=Acipenser ruthenus TaxID=7906 RepID=A0A444U7X6_ACIRT|nr:hypothetical protein EOD39_7198 [Acipenser ruthenus]